MESGKNEELTLVTITHLLSPAFSLAADVELASADNTEGVAAVSDCR